MWCAVSLAQHDGLRVVPQVTGLADFLSEVDPVLSELVLEGLHHVLEGDGAGPQGVWGHLTPVSVVARAVRQQLVNQDAVGLQVLGLQVVIQGVLKQGLANRVSVI